MKERWMGENNPEATVTENLTTSETATFFGCSEGFSRDLMEHLDIPKRGKGYPFRRILLAVGLPHDTPANTPEIREPLLDVADIAKAIGQSERTVRRMVNGTHRDKSFTNALHLGPRKRLLFKFEVDAWRNGIEPMFTRAIESIHPELRKDAKRVSKPKTKKDKSSPKQPPAKSMTSIFVPPNPK